jgi:hypothetical protein
MPDMPGSTHSAEAAESADTADTADTARIPGSQQTEEGDDLGAWAARLRATPVDAAEHRDRGGQEATEPPELPELPDDVRSAAMLAPDHWLGVIDPLWREDQEPPSWAIMGQWRSNSDGEVVEWAENPAYRPSPVVLGWDEPEDGLDAAVQLAATGYGPAEDVPRLLATAEVSVLVDAADAPVTATAPDGTPVVPVFTSPSHLAKMGALRHRVTEASELPVRIPDDHQLYLNPAGSAAFVVDRESFLAAIKESTP